MAKKLLPDSAARTTALTDISRSFLVEAGAGSGKTSIMAGRVAILLAQGFQPKNIAAITFTEFAASELGIRIERFVTELAVGKIPSDLESAFAADIPSDQRANLIRAKKTLDELTCTTIHGFAQALIKPYPAEAGMDPGAQIVDPAEGDLAFDERYQAWLRKHLSGEPDDDVIAELVIAEETRSLAVIRSIAEFLRKNRDAKPSKHVWVSQCAKQFAKAVSAFEQEIARIKFCEDQTKDASKGFIELAKILGDFATLTGPPHSRDLIKAATIPQSPACFTKSGQTRQLRTKGAWERAAAIAGKSRADGTKAFDACSVRYDACHETFAAFMEMIAGELLARITQTMQELLTDWRQYKRSAALLDFDDLLYSARDLLAANNDVRKALANRFQHVLVDEFQDTDPLQIEILWRLCGESPKDENPDPLARVPRPGALFLVGDPKQAVYRFRGADVNAYLNARTAVGKKALLEIVANFRSLEPILAFVNNRFAGPLSLAIGQPGFTSLAATRHAKPDALVVAALDVTIKDEKPSADDLRDAEAERVAELCARLVGNIQVYERNQWRPCRFGDIALLAPVGTELWRFEEALEDRGIPVSTQAGKGFFHRQEVQDLIALTRAIADPRDTLALGALLRGPMVGLTETDLLDIAEGIPVDPNQPNRLPNLTLWTDLSNINHALARQVIEILQSVAKRARTTTPYILLSDAISLLDVRAQLRQRFRTAADRALANVDLFLEMSRAYDVRGLRTFARDMRANWEDQVRQIEGRPDAEEQSVALITVHAAKGLEWPIVIPINMTGVPKTETGLMHDRRSNKFAIPILGIEPPGYAAIRSRNDTELAHERIRLWYVAATRARDLLVLPRHSAKLSDNSWARLVDLGLAQLPAIDPAGLGPEIKPPSALAENTQSSSQFAQEAKRISEAVIPIRWHRPSLHEADAPQPEPAPVFSEPESIELAAPLMEIAGSATRGRILHKLMEEVLTGETKDAIEALESRAGQLLGQLGQEPSADPKLGISPKELATTVLRTLTLPEIAALRQRLVPEQSVFGSESDKKGQILVSGIADAVGYNDDNKVQTIVDWKSDVGLDDHKLAMYRTQLSDYRKQTGANRALLVFMTAAQVIEV
jgi:exodeoxyribonuclease-5